MTAQPTRGPWRAGRKGSVVADYPVPEIGGSDAVDYYGGHLIAESVAPQNVPIIAAAPALRDALKAVAEDVCSLNCPSQWHTEDGPPPHSDKCKAVRAALKQAGKIEQ